MSGKTYGLRINEDELMALIGFHSMCIQAHESPTVEMSARLHDLIKRLNKNEPEIEEAQNNEKSQTKEAW